MSLKSILVAASGGSASNGAIELACRIARRHGALLEGFHVRPNPEELVMAAGAGFGMPIPEKWLTQVNDEATSAAAKTREDFVRITGEGGLRLIEARAGDTVPEGGAATWRESTGMASDAVGRRGRFFDLVVLGRSERVADRPSTDTVEETLLRSGRPVLLAPAEAPSAFGACVAIGWNGSAPAVRAVVGARELLGTAHRVVLITIGDEHQDSAVEMQHSLALHGVAAQLRHVGLVPATGVGGQLLSAARDEGADVLVMGAYGHTPWREFLFGGATRDLIGASLLPVLLAH